MPALGTCPLKCLGHARSWDMPFKLFGTCPLFGTCLLKCLGHARSWDRSTSCNVVEAFSFPSSTFPWNQCVRLIRFASTNCFFTYGPKGGEGGHINWGHGGGGGALGLNQFGPPDHLAYWGTLGAEWQQYKLHITSIAWAY